MDRPGRTVAGVTWRWTRPTATLAVVLLLCSCGAAEDATRGAAEAAREEARQAASEVAEQAVRDQVCRVVGDGQVTEAEVAVLRTAVAGAEGAGLPTELTSAVRDVLGAEGRPRDEAVQRLEDACAR